ncbi:MAG: hypothetical protein AAF654_07470 [Myxococcota bacterium]
MNRVEFEGIQRDATELMERSRSASAPWHLSARALLETNRWRPDAIEALSAACRTPREVYSVLDQAECCAILVRGHAIDLNMEGAWRLLDGLARFAEHGHEQQMIFDVCLHWLEAFTGERSSRSSASDPPAELKAVLRAERLGSMLIDLDTARLMVAMHRRTADMLDGARRLFRRCSSEGFLDREALASLLLARARRDAGQSLTSQHILSEIRRLAPRFMQRALELELSLLGVDTAASPLSKTRAAVASRNRHDATEHARRCLSEVKGTLWFEDVRVWTALLRLDDSEPEHDDVSHWRRCEDADPPRGILDPLAPRQPGWIVCNTNGHNERELASGWFGDVEELALGAQASQSQRALTLLALAPEDGVPVRRFGQALGVSSTERGGAMRVLLHRLRAALRGVARIEEQDDRLVLLSEARWCFRENFRGPGLADRVLAAVVQATRPISSKRIARDIGASVRSVQNELQPLAEDGLCRRLKVGREVLYMVEDTTFKAPTRERWLRLFGRNRA